MKAAVVNNVTGHTLCSFFVAIPSVMTSDSVLYQHAWAPAGIFKMGAKPRVLTKITYFWRTEGANESFRRFRRNLRVYDASAEGVSDFLK